MRKFKLKYKFFKYYKEDILGKISIDFKKNQKIYKYLLKMSKNYKFPFRKFYFSISPPNFKVKDIKRLDRFKNRKSLWVDKIKFRHYYGFLKKKQLVKVLKKNLKVSSSLEGRRLFFIETRLDMLLVKMNFTNSIYSSRQLILHGHVLVNNKIKVRPSFNVKVGDLISIDGKMKSFLYKNLLYRLRNKLIIFNHPSYLLVDYRIMEGIVLEIPRNLSDFSSIYGFDLVFFSNLFNFRKIKN